MEVEEENQQNNNLKLNLNVNNQKETVPVVSVVPAEFMEDNIQKFKVMKFYF